MGQPVVFQHLVHHGGLIITQKIPISRILIIIFLFFLGLVSVAIATFFLSINYSEDVPDISSYELDLTEIRALATSSGDSLPTHINNVLIAKAEFIRGQVISGGWMDPYTFHFSTFQLVYPDSSSIIIDPVHNKTAHETMFPEQPFFQKRFQESQAAMRSAKLILSTHEHFDHVGGIISASHFNEIHQKALLSQEQRSALLNDAEVLSLFPDNDIQSIPFIEYDKYHAVAPGVVLIKAPGHTPGSQMIFVKRQDGKEFLFVGDVVWSMDNILTMTSRPLFSTFFGNEDAAQVANQIKTLNSLMNDAELHIIVAHDGARRKADLDNKLYWEGLQ